VLDISWKVIGVGQLCLLFFSDSLIGDSHVCIVSVLFDITAICVYTSIHMYVYMYTFIL
jgi:hypothetical protein